LKNLSLEGLRGVASLNVVLGHFLFMFFPYLAHQVRPYPNAVAAYRFEELMMYPPLTFTYLADAAVSVFFVLSGYVLTVRFYRTGQSSEFQSATVKRYVRLVLPAAASVLLVWLLSELGAFNRQLPIEVGGAGWVPGVYPPSVNVVYALFNGIVGAPLYGHTEMNGPLWTIQIELIGSILLFACYALLGSVSKLLMIGWFSFLAFVISGRGEGMFYYESILAGSLLHLVESRLNGSQRLSMICLLLGLIGVSFTFAPIFAPMWKMRLPDLSPYGPDLRASYRVFWHSVGAILLVGGVIGSSFAGRVFAWRGPVYLGRVSFAIYLLHFPLLLSVCFGVAALGHAVGMGYLGYVGLGFLATMAVLFTLAELFYRYIDSPSIRLGNWLAAKLERRSHVAPGACIAVRS
jgi:peptidoglycan/LPS O-acetylase OafA/YrhL